MEEKTKKTAKEMVKDFFKGDIFIITSAYVATFVFIGAFAIAFMFIAFPKDPEMEEIYGTYEERKAIRAQSMKSNEETMPSELRIKYAEEHHKID